MLGPVGPAGHPGQPGKIAFCIWLCYLILYMSKILIIIKWLSMHPPWFLCRS